MKSSRYWKMVALLREIQLQRNATYTINQLRQMYNNAVKELDREIYKVFKTFQYGEEITEAEAEELINAESQQRISRKLQAELERTDDPSIKAELTRRIHATAYGARISRLEAVKQNVFIYFTKLAIDEIAKTKTLYNTVVEEAYYRTIHDFGYGVNMGVNFSLLPSRAIDEIVSAKWHGASFSSRVWSNTKETAEQAQEIIAEGLLSRKSYNQMASELAQVTQNSKYNATRLVRTQCNHYLNAGEFRAYEELGIEQYLYLATLDHKTCRRCQPLDGRIFNTKDKREGVNAPTIHPHCRCTTTIPVEFARRWARDPITGKGVKINNMTYAEWVESMSEEQKAAFDKNVKMYKNRSSDKKQYEKYKAIFGDDFPNSFDKFQEMKYTKPKDWNAFKDNKQDRLNKMDFSDMGALVGKLGNKEVREWYKFHDANIPNIIGKSNSLEKQARQACDLRNKYKFEARELMKDQTKRKELDENEPYKSFEDLVRHKKEKYGLSGDDLYRDIIRSSGTTNPDYDKKAGLD